MSTDERPADSRIVLKTAQEHVYNYLREQILSGALQSGERIDLDAVARVLGISRMPVREAVRRLSFEGLVTIYPRRGVFVTPLRTADVLELFEIRAVLEGLVAARAVTAFSSADIDWLSDQVDRMDRSQDDLTSWLRLHEGFHDFICEKANSARLGALVRNLRQHVEPHIRLFLSAYIPEMPGAEHRHLIEVFRAGDPIAADETMKEHVRSAAKAIIKFVRH